MTRIPSFLFNQMPVDTDLQSCIDAGMIPRSVTVFSSKAAYERVPSNPMAPTLGPAQWWKNVSSNPGIGYFRLTGKIKRAQERTLAENRMYSQWAQAFYTERPNLLIPEIELVIWQGWGDLSFARTVTPPAEYPLGEVWMWGENACNHSFPTDCVTFVIEGVPHFERISPALMRFPLQPQMPIGPGANPAAGGYTADQVVAAALASAAFETKMAAAIILNGSASNADKAERLVKL